MSQGSPVGLANGLASKRLERLARDKQCSLLGPLVNHSHKKFNNIGPPDGVTFTD